METSLRYGGDSTVLKIYAKEKFFLDTNHVFQVHGELNTRTGAPSHLRAMLRRFIPDLSASVGMGVQFDRQNKLNYILRGKKAFPITQNGLINFHIKGRCDLDKEFRLRNSTGAAELSWSIFNFQKNQDLRLKAGCDLVHKVPYFQVRENNWTFNYDVNGKWNVRYDL